MAMRFELTHTADVGVTQQLQWLWYSNTLCSFVTGDDKRAVAFPISDLRAQIVLHPDRQRDTGLGRHACNLPIPDSLYDELATRPRDGLRFLTPQEYDSFASFRPGEAGDILRNLVFGSDYGTPVRHTASGAILAFRRGSIELFKLEGGAFALLDKTRTRGKSAMVFAAHPERLLLAYGDNYGDFHIHELATEGFGKARKLGSLERPASAVEFINEGKALLIGGMGYLATFDVSAKKPSEECRVEAAVREIVYVRDGAPFFVNHGMHGVSAYSHGVRSLARIGQIKLPFPVNQMVVSPDSGGIAVTAQGAPQIAFLDASEGV